MTERTLPNVLNRAWKEPGDFLYYHPYSDEYQEATDYEGGGQHVRNMFELAEDDEHERWRWITALYSHCRKCAVAWDSGKDGPLCWACGTPGTERREPSF